MSRFDDEFWLGLGLSIPEVASRGGLPSWLPIVGGVAPTLFADFTAGHYLANGTVYPFAAWNTAISGVITRAGSATYLNAGSILSAGANTHRFPTALNGSPLGLRLTGPGTNLHLHSSISDSVASYTPGAATLTANAGTDPSGGSSAAALVPSTGNVQHFFFLTAGVTVSGSTVYTYSIFSKPNGFTNFEIDGNNGATNFATFSMIGAGSVLNTTGCTAAISQLANGWYLASITWTQAGAGTPNPIIYTTGNGTTRPFIGDGTSGYFFWGEQFTASANPLDYIPTTTATVTQAADAYNIGNITWANLSHGSFVSSGFGEDTVGTDVFMAYNNAGNNYGAGSGFLLRITSANQYNAGGTGSAANISGPSIANFKAVGIYDVPTTLQRVVAGDGSNNENSTLDFTGVGVANLAVGELQNSTPGTQSFYGNLKSIAFYPIAASVAQATALFPFIP